jgi:hypothetical protein
MEAAMASDETPDAKSPRLTARDVWRALDKHSFAVISHVTASGEPRSSGVVYGTDGDRILVVVAASSWKARTIADDQLVAVTVPVRRGGILALLFPIPPAVISFRARAKVGEPCMLARESLPKKFARLLPPAVAPSCVIELTPEGSFLTYGIGVSLRAMSDPAVALARVPVA